MILVGIMVRLTWHQLRTPLAGSRLRLPKISRKEKTLSPFYLMSLWFILLNLWICKPSCWSKIKAFTAFDMQIQNKETRKLSQKFLKSIGNTNSGNENKPHWGLNGFIVHFVIITGKHCHCITASCWVDMNGKNWIMDTTLFIWANNYASSSNMHDFIKGGSSWVRSDWSCQG